LLSDHVRCLLLLFRQITKRLGQGLIAADLLFPRGQVGEGLIKRPFDGKLRLGRLFRVRLRGILLPGGRSLFGSLHGASRSGIDLGCLGSETIGLLRFLSELISLFLGRGLFGGGQFLLCDCESVCRFLLSIRSRLTSGDLFCGLSRLGTRLRQWLFGLRSISRSKLLSLASHLFDLLLGSQIRFASGLLQLSLGFRLSQLLSLLQSLVRRFGSGLGGLRIPIERFAGCGLSGLLGLLECGL